MRRNTVGKRQSFLFPSVAIGVAHPTAHICAAPGNFKKIGRVPSGFFTP